MHDRRNAQADSWQRNRMVWLVVGIPLLTVLGCMLTIYLAISSPDPLVSDYSLRNDTSPGR